MEKNTPNLPNTYEGNSYTTEFRQYDSRLGRWLSLDPLMKKFPWMSPYVAFNNDPVYFTDPLGLESGKGSPDDTDHGGTKSESIEGGGVMDPVIVTPKNRSYYSNSKGFVIETKFGSGFGGEYLGNVMPPEVNSYHVLIFKEGKLVHKNVHNNFLGTLNYIFGSDYVTNKDYDPAEESFNEAQVEFTIDYFTGKALGNLGGFGLKLFKKAKGSLWKVASDSRRGFLFEEIWNKTGANLRNIKGYNVIDDFRDGIATSLKTLNLGAKGYIKNSKSVYHTLKRYTDKLYKFSGVNKGGVNTINKITSKVLEVAIPKGATPQQVEMIEKAIKYAADKGIEMKVYVVK